MCRRKSLSFFVLIFFCLKFGNVESKNSEIVEGSGNPTSLNDNKNIVAADIDWEASGIGPDDEDGDVVEGSGSMPMNQKNRDEVEGSGLPISTPKKPIVIPDESKIEEIVKTENLTTISTKKLTTLTPIGTTIITITKDEIEKEDLGSEFKFPENDDKEEDEDDDEEEENTSTEATTTTEKMTTTTKKSVIAVITESPIFDDDSDSDALKNMLQPGILAAITGGAVVGILLAILLIMFIIYRIRKKDEGSYSVDENSHHPPNYTYAYQKAATQEFYA